MRLNTNSLAPPSLLGHEEALLLPVIVNYNREFLVLLGLHLLLQVSVRQLDNFSSPLDNNRRKHGPALLLLRLQLEVEPRRVLPGRTELPRVQAAVVCCPLAHNGCLEPLG